MRRRASIGTLALALALGGCGGSGSSSSASSSSPPTSTTTTTSSTSAATTSSTTRATSTTPKTRAATTAQLIFLPAAFVIEPGGSLSPPQVAAPPHTAIRLIVRSHDGHSHRISLGTPQPHSFEVTAAHDGAVLLSGLKNGTYPVDVDGHPRGKLIVGVTPGP